MAGSAEKKKAAANEAYLALLGKVIMGVLGAYLVIRMGFFRASTWWLLWILLVAVAVTMLIAYRCLAAIAHTHPDPVSSALGICEYARDIIYLSVIVLSLGIISDWFWLIFLVVPVYAIYMFWTHIFYPYIFNKRPEEEEETPEMRKKREKMEKKANRPKFKASRGR